MLLSKTSHNLLVYNVRFILFCYRRSLAPHVFLICPLHRSKIALHRTHKNTNLSVSERPDIGRYRWKPSFTFVLSRFEKVTSIPGLVGWYGPVFLCLIQNKPHLILEHWMVIAEFMHNDDAPCVRCRTGGGNLLESSLMHWHQYTNRFLQFIISLSETKKIFMNYFRTFNMLHFKIWSTFV